MSINVHQHPTRWSCCHYLSSKLSYLSSIVFKYLEGPLGERMLWTHEPATVWQVFLEIRKTKSKSSNKQYTYLVSRTIWTTSYNIFRRVRTWMQPLRHFCEGSSLLAVFIRRDIMRSLEAFVCWRLWLLRNIRQSVLNIQTSSLSCYAATWLFFHLCLLVSPSLALASLPLVLT